MILKKKFLQALVGRKKYMQHKYNRKLMGKKKVLVAKTSHQMLEILLFSGRERALSRSMEISLPTFVVKKSTMKLCGVSILRE